jgi:hypothetical protein
MPYKKLDYAEIEKKYDPTKTDKENAFNIGISEDTFRKWRTSKGYEPAGMKKIDYDEVEKMYDPNISDAENAFNMDISIQSFRNWRYKKGHPALGTPIRHPEFIKYYHEKLSDTEIAYMLDKSKEAVQAYREKLELPANPENTCEPEFTPDEESLYCDCEFLKEIKKSERPLPTSMWIYQDTLSRIKNEQLEGETQDRTVDRILDEVEGYRDIFLDLRKILESGEEEKKIVEDVKKIIGVE